MRFNHFALFAVATLAFASCGSSVSIEERIEDTLSQMTLEEKVAMVHAQSKFSSPGVPRLGIPEIWCTDGPHGIRTEVLWDEWVQAGWTSDSCTAFPALTCLAATWNRELAHLYGKSIGEEAKYRKKTVLLGPGVNIYRTVLGGRNFEYMGEDPYLASQMVVPYISGVQENNVAACVKHFALNNDEIHRHTVNVNVDERTLHEIYLPAFKAAVTEGHAWAIMGAYNLYKDQHNCTNQYLLNDILKGEWGFDGVVISDWGGVHETEAAASNGLDLEYGSWTDGLTMGATNGYDRYFLASPYLEGLRSGKYDVADLDEKVRRLLRLEFRTNMNHDVKYGRFTCPDHYAAARKIGAEGIVLLKNENDILPISSSARRILVVGENAIKMMTVGGGSSSLKAQHEVSPLDGIRMRFPESEVKYERGYVGDVNTTHSGVSTGQDLSEARSEQQLIEDAVREAMSSDYVVFIGGLNKSHHQDAESADRQSYGLPYSQDALIEALADAVPEKLIVVNISGNAVAMPWVNKVRAVVQDWYLGSEAGNSLADVLSGDVNPSGKLPISFPVSYEDNPVVSQAQYPGIRREGVDPNDKVNAHYDEYYSEGIYVGYRWYDTKNIKPAFAFGHGLSYTSFEYSDAKVSNRSMKRNGSVDISVSVKNTGRCAGAEVVQLYITDIEASVDRPSKELKGFEKIYLQPGESKVVRFTVKAEDLSFYSAEQHKWVAESGTFTAHLASGSDDMRESVTFELR